MQYLPDSTRLTFWIFFRMNATKKITGFSAILLIAATTAAFAQVPCDPLKYFNPNGQEYVHTMNLPTVWWGVKCTPDLFDSELDSAFIGFGIEKNTSMFLYDSLEVRVLRDTLPLIQVVDYYKSAIPASSGTGIPDSYWVVELDFDQVMAQFPPGRSFWVTWRLKGPAADVGRTIMKMGALNKDRSIVLNTNGTYQTVTQYLQSSSFTDSVDLWAEARVCYFNGKPVELTAFTAAYKEDKGLLEWNTATETNNFGFEVERAAGISDAGSVSLWQKIAFVNGGGTSASPRVYRFIDPNPREVMDGRGIVRYRLRQIDYDGSASSSPVVELRIPFAGQGVELHQNYPNPFSRTAGYTTLSFTLNSARPVEIDLYDMLGQHVHALLSGTFAAGTHEHRIHAADLRPGSYVAVLNSGGVRLVRRISLLD